MPTERKLRVFLCHASQDKPIVRELYQRLNAEDWIDPWLDEEKLLPGQEWDIEIEKAVETADAVIVCLSNTSVTKEGYVQRELKYALDIALEKPEGTIFIIPLRLENCALPRRLRIWHYLDFFPMDHRDKAFARLRDSLKVRFSTTAIEAPKSDTELPDTLDTAEDVHGKKLLRSEADSKLALTKLLDNKFGFDEFWSLCDEIGQKMRQDGVTELFSLGSFGDGRPKHQLIFDVITFLEDHNSLEYLMEMIKNKYPGLIKNEEEPLKTDEQAFAKLSQQEKHVLFLLSEGKTNQEIAKALFLGESTVRNYVQSLLSKLGLANRIDAAAYAVKYDLRNHIATE